MTTNRRTALGILLGGALLLELLVQATPVHAADFIVTNTNDSGPGSLRRAIQSSNATFLGPNHIYFHIVGTSIEGGFQTKTITLTKPLPTITRPVTIDGTSQRTVHSHFHCSVTPGHPCIEIKGGGLTQASSSILTIAAGNSTIKGLTINGPADALGGSALITLTLRGHNVIAGNYLGTNITGAVAAPTTGVNQGMVGIRIQSSDNRIGGVTAAQRNLISGNGGGVEISPGAMNNTVQGNYIGTDYTGTAGIPNSAGIRIGASSNTIGGTVQGAGNLISGNNGTGIDIGGTGNVVVGNFIGTDATGTHALGNAIGIGIYSSNNRVGGTSAAERNIISGNHGDPANMFDGGIYVYGVGALIQGNYIGIDVSGTRALPNAQGILVFDTGAVTIGGTAPGAGNVISGNSGYGVRFMDVVEGSLVQGNFIGTQCNGSSTLGNGSDGVFLDFASGVTIGGMTAGAGNTIAYNRGAGVAVGPGPNMNPGTSDAILGNAIFANGGLGIDLGSDGVTSNDPGDADTGANNLQNFPVLTSTSSNGASTTVQGTLNSAANASFRIEFFASTACGPSGFGAGQTFLGAAAVTTDAAGNAIINVSLPVGVPAGQQVTATATDPNNNTSEFSGCQPVVATP